MIALVPWVAALGYTLIWRGLGALAGWPANYGGRPMGIIEAMTPPPGGWNPLDAAAYAKAAAAIRDLHDPDKPKGRHSGGARVR